MLLVPHHFVGYWQVDGQRIAYADFQLRPPNTASHERSNGLARPGMGKVIDDDQ